MQAGEDTNIFAPEPYGGHTALNLTEYGINKYSIYDLLQQLRALAFI